MTALMDILERFGADPAAVRSFDVDGGPELLPYAALLTARSRGGSDLAAVYGVYEWQNVPLMFLVDSDSVRTDRERLNRIRRLVAMRGDAPYLGVVGPGRLDVYRVSLDGDPIDRTRIDLAATGGEELTTFARLGNSRPGAQSTQRRWISQVLLKLLDTSIDSLLVDCNLKIENAISLVGRALFTRFLGDRDLLPPFGASAEEAAGLFDNPRRAGETSAWLDETFNGDFLPLTPGIFDDLPAAGFKVLGDISRRAPGGQLHLGWQERWDNLDFAHIPVGVLSQAYERYLSEHEADKQHRQGGYYTPRHIAELMVRGAFEALARDGRTEPVRVLDPAAGAGVFLLTTFRQLVAERWRRDGERPDTAKLREILYDQITGFDIDESALRFAALGLYLISIEMDPQPEPVEKLRFRNLRGTVLHMVGPKDKQAHRTLGSLGPDIEDRHRGCYDLVIGNPPWVSRTKLPGWEKVRGIVGQIARDRLVVSTSASLLPNEVLDLPFIWRAMEWARPAGQIAFALHARLLFQQGKGMPQARQALFSALDVTGIVNGADLRQSRVWPGISAPFCLLFAQNQIPPPGAGFRFVSPRLEDDLNETGVMRIDAGNAEIITVGQISARPEIFKILFRGGEEDLKIYEKLKATNLTMLAEYWRQGVGPKGEQLLCGNGYQKLRDSSEKQSDDGPGIPATYLHGLPELTSEAMEGVLVSTKNLPLFTAERLHRGRPRALFNAPLLLVHQSPPARSGRIRVAIAMKDVLFSETYYGYSACRHPRAQQFIQYLALVIGSKLALWLALITSGKFGVERDVIEKSTIDRILVPNFDTLEAVNVAQIDPLFRSVVTVDNEGAWTAVDRWVANLYGLRTQDLQVIDDTLRYNLPAAENRRLAQQRPSDAVVRKFCEVLQAELQPWGKRAGRTIVAFPMSASTFSPWRGLQIESIRDPVEKSHLINEDWTPLLHAADQFEATDLMYPDPYGSCLWIGRLDQARYWSETQARMVARRVIWNHVDVLTGRVKN